MILLIFLMTPFYWVTPSQGNVIIVVDTSNCHASCGQFGSCHRTCGTYQACISGCDPGPHCNCYDQARSGNPDSTPNGDAENSSESINK